MNIKLRNYYSPLKKSKEIIRTSSVFRMKRFINLSSQDLYLTEIWRKLRQFTSPNSFFNEVFKFQFWIEASEKIANKVF